jgi:hypothetical protein
MKIEQINNDSDVNTLPEDSIRKKFLLSFVVNGTVFIQTPSPLLMNLK